MTSFSDLDLLQAYLDGELSAEEEGAVETRLRQDAGFAEHYVRLAREEAMLVEWAKSMALAETEVRDMRAVSFRSMALVHGRRYFAAAGLLAMIGAGMALLPTSVPASQPLAWLEDVQGEVFVRSKPAKSGQPLILSDNIRTSGEGGSVVVRYPDRTRLVLGPDSLLHLQGMKAGEGKRLYLEEGYVYADVAKQPAGKPMILATPHAQVAVLGTRFSSSAVKRGTRVELEEGRIRVTSEGKSLDVREVGSVVDVSVTAPTPAQPQSAPQQVTTHRLPTAVKDPLVVLPQGGGPVQSLAYAPLGDLLAVGGWKGTVDVWDMQAQLLRHTWLAQQKKTRALAWSPDGMRIATGSDDKTAKVWDAETGKLLATLPKFKLEIEALTFSPDGAFLAVASGIRPSPSVVSDITLWDARTGDLRGRMAGHTGIITSLDFSPDGKTLASGAKDGEVRLWDVATLTETACLSSGEPVQAVAFSPDGKTLAAGSRERVIRLWDVPTLKLRKLLEGHLREVKSLAFSPDGKYLASGGDPTIRVWEVNSGEGVALFQGHKYAVTCVRFSPDGRTIASAGWDGQVKLWSLDEGLHATLPAATPKNGKK